MTPTVAVVIPTYQRRRMLYEALASVVDARPDELVLIDDGTDAYDVAAMYERCIVAPAIAQGWQTRFTIVSAPPMTVERRMTQPRQGRLINEALRDIRSTVATILCDDDLMAYGWLDTVRAHWAANPTARLVRGDWLVFQDGDTPSDDDPPCPMDMHRKMTAGNFAWDARLTREGKAEWPETRLNCLDAGFLDSLRVAGVNTFRALNIGMAGWRREHPLVNGAFSDGTNHTPAFRAVLERGMLE